MQRTDAGQDAPANKVLEEDDNHALNDAIDELVVISGELEEVLNRFDGIIEFLVDKSVEKTFAHNRTQSL